MPLVNEVESPEEAEFDISLLEAEVEDILINYEDLLPVDPSCSISAIINVSVSPWISHWGPVNEMQKSQ